MTQHRILLVEDHLYIRRVLTDQLDHAGYYVVAASSAEEALLRFATQPIDLVLTDLHLPGLSGLAFAAQLRAAGGLGARMPIFAMTAGSLAEDGLRCAEAGITMLLAKPLSIARFRLAAERCHKASLALRNDASLATASVRL